MAPIKFSICIPHYNRSAFLLLVLDSIRIQNYPYIEVIISDDCSSDNSEQVIPAFIEEYQDGSQVVFRYIRQTKNLGYDRNLRTSMMAATGDYLFLLGNDDALANDYTLSHLATILENLSYPNMVFANFHPYELPDQIVRRAKQTAVLGSGPDIAVKYFRSFSFVGSVIVKQTSFIEHNTNTYDGSIYFQIYLAARIASAGGTLASINDSLVAKDVQIGGQKANSHVDVLAKSNQILVPKAGGLESSGARSR